MKLKTIVTVLIALAVVLPVAAKKKKSKTPAPTPKRVITINASSIVVVINSKETKFKLTPETEIYNKRQEKVTAEELEGTRFVLLTFDPNNPTVVTKVQEYVMSPTTPGKSKSKKKK